MKLLAKISLLYDQRTRLPNNKDSQRILRKYSQDFETLTLSGLMSQDRKIDFTEECSLVTLLAICQQWVNLLEDFSPYSS